MSLQTLKIELDGLHGRNLFPNRFPIDLLISLTRELALQADGSLSLEDVVYLTRLMEDYFRRVFEMQGNERFQKFNGKLNHLMAPLGQELYECMREEILSKCIGYDIRGASFQERFIAVLDKFPDGIR